MSGSEGAAISLLKRAVELDGKKRFSEAIVCYKEGLQLLLETMRTCGDDKKKAAYRTKATEYMDRAEKLSQIIEDRKKSGQFHEQRRIEADSTGNSYSALFGRFLDDDVTEVDVEDPYVRSHHQVMNFVRLCELLVKKCGCLKVIRLLTGPEPQPSAHRDQVHKLEELEKDLNDRGICLTVNYSETLHDREIRLNSGWVIKIGRGLDIYKPPKSKISLGQFDCDFRKCHETTVDIFHKTSMIKAKTKP